MSKSNNRLILYLILLLAAVLRFYHYREIPLTHDELSALTRVAFSSFSELIEKVVRGCRVGGQTSLYHFRVAFRLAGLPDRVALVQ